MTQQEMAQLTTDLYMGKLTLDVNSYRAALQKLSENLESEEDALAAAQVSHIKSVQAAQNQMQLSDVVFASPATGGLAVPEGIHWLTAAVQEANKNRSRVSVLAGKTEVAVINILSLPTHGMMSQKLLHQVRSSVLMQSDMCGPILLMYPLIPRTVYKAKRTMAASAATGADLTAAADGDDDSNDSEDDIFGEEGQLPEVLTKASTTMSKWERDAALARDRFEIDSVLGQHDLTQVCPQSDHFVIQTRRLWRAVVRQGPPPDPSAGPWRHSAGLWRHEAQRPVREICHVSRRRTRRPGAAARVRQRVEEIQHGMSPVPGLWLENGRAHDGEAHLYGWEDRPGTDRIADLRGLAHRPGQTLHCPKSFGERFHGRSGRSRGRSSAGEGVRSCEAVRSARVLLGL